MSFFRFLRKIKNFDNKSSETEKACIARIKNAVAERCGTDEFIDCDDSSVAFSGSEEHKELLLELYTTKDKKGTYLNARVDDNFSWDESCFSSLSDFENDIIEHIANRVNRTIKTVIKTEKHKSYHETVYYLNEESNEWVMLEEEHTEDETICRLFADKTETVEIIKTYKLE